MKIINKLKPYADKQLFVIIIGFYTAFTFVGLLKLIYFKSIGERFVDNTWSYMFFEIYFLDYILVILFMSIVSMITKYMVVNGMKWHKIIIAHLFLSVSLGFFIFYSIALVQTLLGSVAYQDLTIERVLYFYMNVLDLNFLIYFSIVVITHIYLNRKQLKENHLQKLQLTQNLAEAKIKILHSQIQPHFLFNTLNNIQTLIDIDKEKSKSMLVDLSDLLRMVIDYKNENLSELQDELSLLDKFLGIVKIRFSKDLKIHKNIEDDLENILVPSMLLQIIFENAIKHGYSEENLQLTVWLTIKKVNDKLLIIVENNGKLLTDTLEENINNGLGIKNIQARLNLLYPNNFDFKISNNSNHVCVQIMLPISIAEYQIGNFNNS